MNTNSSVIHYSITNWWSSRWRPWTDVTTCSASLRHPASGTEIWTEHLYLGLDPRVFVKAYSNEVQILYVEVLRFLFSEVRLAFKKKSYGLHPDRQVVQLIWFQIAESDNRNFTSNSCYLQTPGQPWCICKLCQRQWGFCGDHQGLWVPCHAIRQRGRTFQTLSKAFQVEQGSIRII